MTPRPAPLHLGWFLARWRALGFVLLVLTLPLGAQPFIDRVEPLWVSPGDQVEVTGGDLDQVRSVHLGNLGIRAFHVGAGGATLGFRLPEHWRIRTLSPQILRLGYLETLAGKPVRREIQAHRPLFQNPAGRPPEEAHILPEPAISWGLEEPGADGTLLHLRGQHLDYVDAASLEDLPLTLVWVRKDHLVLMVPAHDGPPYPGWGTLRLTFVAGRANDPAPRDWELPGMDWIPRAPGGRWLVPPAAAAPAKAGASEAEAPKAEETKAIPAKQKKVRLAAMYLTQAAQRLDGSIPLVEGRAAALRVFPVATTEYLTARYRLRVTLRDRRGRVLLERELEEPPWGLPPAIDEGMADRNWNLAIPGELVRSGTTVLAELLKAGSPKVLDRLPASGEPMALQVVHVPPIRITLFPIRRHGLLGEVEGAGRTLESWTVRFRQLFPVDEVRVDLGEVLEPATEAGGDPEEALAQLADALEAKRLLDDPWNRRYYFGVAPAGALGGTAGFAARVLAIPGLSLGRSAVAWDRLAFLTPADVFAHEMGHALGLAHAPGGGARGVDPDYLPADGHLDVSGFDPVALAAKDCERHFDLMSYARGPLWISAFHWSKALAQLSYGEPELHRLARERGAPGRPAPPEPRPCLLVRGRRAGDRILWEPAFELRTLPTPTRAGNCRLARLDREGRTLASVPFQLASVPFQLAGGDGVFEFLVPLSGELAKALFRFKVFEGDQELALVAAWSGQPLGSPSGYGGGAGLGLGGSAGLGLGGSPGAGQAVVQQPVARRSGGRVTLDWDPGVYPGVLVLDPATGRHLATLKAGAADFQDAGLDELELVLSDGLRSTGLRVPVQ